MFVMVGHIEIIRPAGSGRWPKRLVIGQKFGRLTVDQYLGQGPKGLSIVRCRCDCGSEHDVVLSRLSTGRSSSCGCVSRERGAIQLMKHGMSDDPAYHAYIGMIKRTVDPENPGFHNYGGRGVKVCDRWLSGVEFFLTDMGPRPSPQHSIDRIDNDGDYCPENCRWATKRDQAINRSTTVWLELDGHKMCSLDVAREIGVNRTTIFNHVKKTKARVATSFVCKGRTVVVL
jgi:hypothetical protein